jgi:hypothetical protein
MNSEFVGEWAPDGYVFIEIGKPTDPPSPADIANWLLGAEETGRSRMEPRSGLELTIRPDGSFSEQVLGGQHSVLWYDSEGVQTDSPEPSEGSVREIAGADAVSLHPRISPPPGPHRPAALRDVLRYDDGDTQVSDILQVAGRSLIRVISVVTDGLYFNRVVASYRRERATVQ